MTDNLKPTFTTIYSSSNDERRVTNYELELEPFKNDETTTTTTRDYAKKNGSTRMKKYIGDRKGWFICLGLMMSFLIAVLVFLVMNSSHIIKCMKTMKHQFINETKFFEVKIVPDYFNQQEINDLNKVLVNSLKRTKYFANITDNLVVLNETARLSLNEEIRNVLNDSVVASVNKVRLFVLNNSIINRLNGQNEPIMTGIDKIFQDKRLDKMYYNVFFVMNEIVQSSLNETVFAALNQTILNFLNNKVLDALTAHQVILRNETNKAIFSTIENVQIELNSKLLDTLYNKVIVAIEDKVSAYLKNKREEDLKLMG